MDDRVGEELGDDAVDESPSSIGADVGGDPLAGELLPGRDRVSRSAIGVSELERALDPAPSVEVVDDHDLVPRAEKRSAVGQPR